MPVRVLSVATDISHIGAQNLLKSALFHGETIEFIGDGETWGGWTWRMNKYKDALALIHDDDIVVCVDAYDVLVTDSLQLLPQLFQDSSAKILVSSDSWCFGRNCKYIPTFHEKRKRESLNPYVCMGIVAGRPRELEKMYQEILDLGIQDDQIGLATFMEKHAGDPGIELDDDEILACNVTGLKHFDPTTTYENTAMFTHFPSFVTWTGFSLSYRNHVKKHTKNGTQYKLFGKYRQKCQLIGLFILILMVLKFFL